MSYIRVGVLRGGAGHETEKSLKIGGSILRNMPERCKGYDIFVDKKGEWHFRGVNILHGTLPDFVDIVFNAAHSVDHSGAKLHQELQSISLPYTGSGLLPSIIALHKEKTKKALADIGVSFPVHKIVSASDDMSLAAEEIFKNIPLPIIIKPARSGSSFGVSLVKSYGEIPEAILRALQYSNSVVVEEYIRGKEAMCSVVEDFRGEKYYVLPPVETRTSDYNIFDHESKSANTGEHICPGCFTKEEKRMVMEAARKAHEVLGFRHYSSSDFIVSPRGIYFLEANTLPDIYEDSHFAKSLESVGVKLPEFIEHTLNLAVDKK